MPVCHWYAALAGLPQHLTQVSTTMIRIPLWNCEGRFAIVDDADAFLSQWRWRVDDQGYAQTSLGGARVFMHSMLIAVPGGRVVDHRNRDRTDNRRENLRIASPRENAANRGRRMHAHEPFVGVRQTASGRWQARIGERGRHLGVFNTAEEAARARDAAARIEYGDFATLNFSPDLERSVNVRPPLALPSQDSGSPSSTAKAKASRRLKEAAPASTDAKGVTSRKRQK